MEKRLDDRLCALPEELRARVAAFAWGIDDAAARGLLFLVKLLHRHGETSGRPSQFALLRASMHGHLEIVQYLHLHGLGYNSSAAELVAAMNGYLAILQFLHAHRPDRHGFGMTIVDRTAANGHLNVVHFLLNNSAHFTVAAVDRAAENGHEEMVELLLQHQDRCVTYDGLDGRPFTTLGIEWARRNQHTRIADRLHYAMTGLRS